MGKENDSQARKYPLAQIRAVLNIIVNGYSQYPVDFSQPGIFATSPPETSTMVLHSILDRVNWKRMTIDSNPEHTLEKSPLASKEHRLALDNEAHIHDFILNYVQYHNNDVKNVVHRPKKSNKEEKKKKEIQAKARFIPFSYYKRYLGQCM